MREHSECDEAINVELARGNDGRAEFLATRCDLTHGVQATPTPTPARDQIESEAQE